MSIKKVISHIINLMISKFLIDKEIMYGKLDMVLFNCIGGDLVSTGNQVFCNACRICHLSRKDGGEN